MMILVLNLSTFTMKTVTYKDQSIWVIKKNKTVLENLILWFHEQIKKSRRRDS